MDQRTEILILENRMCENKKGLTTGWMLPSLMWTDTTDFEAKFRLVRHTVSTVTFLALGTRAGIWSAFGQSDVPRSPPRLDMSLKLPES